MREEARDRSGFPEVCELNAPDFPVPDNAEQAEQSECLRISHCRRRYVKSDRTCSAPSVDPVPRNAYGTALRPAWPRKTAQGSELTSVNASLPCIIETKKPRVKLT